MYGSKLPPALSRSICITASPIKHALPIVTGSNAADLLQHLNSPTNMQKSLYRDYDALAYNPKHVGEERGAINHIKKTKQRKKGVEIVFDPKAHK